MTEINYTLLRDQEMVPIAREILKRIASRDDLVMGSSESATQEELNKYYSMVYLEDVVPVITAKNVKISDIPFLASIMRQAIDMSMDVCNKTLNHARAVADSAMYGVENVDEMRVMTLHNKLIELFPEVKKGVDNSVV